MQTTTDSPTSVMTLDGVISTLAGQHMVEGILLMGSVARSAVGPTSDYDMAVVLAEVPGVLHSGLVPIDGRITDLFFATADAVNRLADRAEPVAAGSWQGLLVRWLTAGPIAFDRHGHLERARQAVQDAGLIQATTPGDTYSTW